MIEPVVLVHGGAAVIAEERIAGKVSGVKAAAQAGYTVLVQGGTAVDAVEAAIRSMEDNEHFNAGYGAVLTVNGEAELDASIMDGIDLSAGAVAMVRDIAHPISLARRVRELTPHVLLAGPGASAFARDHTDIQPVPPADLVSPYSLKILNMYKARGCRPEDRELGGTVGAVVVDKDGNVAAGTSTGGTTGKLAGRIGDTPLIGAGTYADNCTGAVSCTGTGEAIIKSCMAHSTLHAMSCGMSAADATADCVRTAETRVHGKTGAITVSCTGSVGIHFSTGMMPWCYLQDNQLYHGLLPTEHHIETLTSIKH
ncbi:uncharacterized protein CBL_08957 [Carabus blaptoides fortunei]